MKLHHQATKDTKTLGDLRALVVNLSFRHAARTPLGDRGNPGHDELFWLGRSGLSE